jgi:endonuclease/exonuclease/phosphatase family metal-dependent hydrolase
LKLCLYNVENLFLLNHGPGEGYKKPLDKIEWVARTIREIDADIVMLCEVGGLQSLDLFNARHLNNNYFTALLPGNSDRGIEMGYLINKRFAHFHQLLSHKEKHLEFNYPHEVMEHKNTGKKLKMHRFSRDIAELRLTKDGKIEFIILLVHLKSKLDKEGIDFNGQMRRKAELHTLVETYNLRRDEHPGVPVIVAGDFNGQAQRHAPEPEFSALYEKTDLQDILEVINEPLDRRSSYYHFNRDYVREASQLDYIMLPPELWGLVKKEESGIYQYRDPHGVVLPLPQDSFQRYALPSDHYPVVATLKI